MQILVIQFKPYVTLSKRGMYRQSELMNRVGLACMVLHFWKVFSKDSGSFPFRNEWTKRQICISTTSLTFFHSLKRCEDDSRKSEKDIMRKAFLYLSSLSLMNLELERNQIWQPYRRFKYSVIDIFEFRFPNIISYFWEHTESSSKLLHDHLWLVMTI